MSFDKHSHPSLDRTPESREEMDELVDFLVDVTNAREDRLHAYNLVSAYLASLVLEPPSETTEGRETDGISAGVKADVAGVLTGAGEAPGVRQVYEWRDDYEENYPSCRSRFEAALRAYREMQSLRQQDPAVAQAKRLTFELLKRAGASENLAGFTKYWDADNKGLFSQDYSSYTVSTFSEMLKRWCDTQPDAQTMGEQIDDFIASFGSDVMKELDLQWYWPQPGDRVEDRWETSGHGDRVKAVLRPGLLNSKRHPRIYPKVKCY